MTTEGRSIGGKAIDAQPHVAGRADDDQAQDEHRGEDRTLDADRGEFLHGAIPAACRSLGEGRDHLAGAAATGARPPATRTGVPSTRLPGWAITGSPAARPLEDLEPLGGRGVRP